MERLNLRQLRQQRLKLFWQGIAPYFRYVGGSLPGFILLVGFSLYGYGYFVNHLPDRFPAHALIAVLLAIPLSSSSVRTYLRDADVVFLLPMESRMPAYLNPSLRSAYVSHFLILMVIWFILWPLFQAAQEQSSNMFSIIWLQLALMKGIVIYGGWQENQFRESRTRQTFSWIRSVTIGLLIYVVLTQSVAWSLLSFGVASIIYLLALRAAARYTIHWERLIVLEHKSRSQWISFFNLFVEVPREHSLVRQTRWLHRIARLLAFKKSNAYRYLYLLTWIRSDLFRVVVRLTILGILLILIMNSTWIKLGLLALFTYVTKLQLSELEHYHKNAEVSSVYPVQQEQRAGSARFIALRVHMAVLVILVGSFLISYLSQ
jgi:ABC-2 type transport system permease protein